MKCKDTYTEYESLGTYLERIRKGKKIPLRIFEDNGISSRTYQRFVKGENDIRAIDLAIIIEILGLSPMECLQQFYSYSKTIDYRDKFMKYLFKKDYVKSKQIMVEYEFMYNEKPFTIGKQEVYYSMLALDYQFNNQGKHNVEKILEIENNILDRLENAEVYTIDDLKFIALQHNLGLQRCSPSLYMRIVKRMPKDIIIDLHTARIVENALIDLLVSSIGNKRNKRDLELVLQLFDEYPAFEDNWQMYAWKKIAKLVEKVIDNKKNLEEWYSFKNKLLDSVKLFITEQQQEILKLYILKIEEKLL